ncbi:MAG: amidohydrolase [Planctomycetaceae bacterium]|nr:amidohydrolase [Planctomycetaceae bacterium]
MKIAGVQMDVTLGDVEANLDKIEDRLRETRSAGATFTVFPECAVTGYCFESIEAASPHAQTIPGPATERLTRLCQELGSAVVFGTVERSADQHFNAAVLVDETGVVGSYRKVHLPYLGVDMHVNYGDREFAVHETGGVKVGMNICYDSAFPESSRCLSLLGADLVALPTNWPPGAECVAANVINTRALENGIYYIAVNRVGVEAGFEFIGRSRICAPSGETLAASDGTEETILYADIDIERARNKRVVREVGRHAIDRMADRRPEMYAPMIEPHSLARPGR